MPVYLPKTPYMFCVIGASLVKVESIVAKENIVKQTNTNLSWTSCLIEGLIAIKVTPIATPPRIHNFMTFTGSDVPAVHTAKATNALPIEMNLVVADSVDCIM